MASRLNNSSSRWAEEKATTQRAALCIVVAPVMTVSDSRATEHYHAQVGKELGDRPRRH